MQFLSSLGSARDRQRPSFEKEESAGSRLPYARHFNDSIIELRNGNLMQVIRLDGLLFETADSAELNYRKTLRDALLRSIGNSRFALYHHIMRRKTRLADSAGFPDAFSASLDHAWHDRLSARHLYANELFLTVMRRPAAAGSGVIDATLDFFGLSTKARDEAALIAAEANALEAATDQIITSLSTYRPRLLTIYDTPYGPCSEPLEFLSALYNASLRPVRLPFGDAGHYIPYRRISFGQRDIELGSTQDEGKTFAAIISVKDYPGQTTPGMLDDILRIPAEMMLTQSFAFVDRQAGLGRMNLALRRMRASDDEAISLRGELGQAKDDFAAGRAAFGEHHLTIMVKGDSIAHVDAGVAEVQSALADLGIVAVREDVGLEAAFWAQFPGNFKYIARRALISSANFASFASNHNFPSGKASGNIWGDYITVFETTSAGPYYFNFHQGDLGNFTIIGPSGSGKTVILNFVLAQALKHRPRLAFFDKDRGAELFIRAIGGEYDVLRPGIPSVFNPLQLTDSAENRNFIATWLGLLASAGGEPLTPEDRQQIVEAIAANYAAPRHLRRLRSLAQLFRGDRRPHARDLFARLQPWWGEGAHAWLFDNVDDRVDLSQSIVGFDMTQILDSPILRTPVMLYLFHRIDERMDGQPTMIVIDEGWKALDDEIFVDRIRDWEKTIRKRNGIVGFVTQNAEDALASRIGSTIIEQSATQIFTPNPKARTEDYVGGFGLTQHELDIVRGLPDNSHSFLIKHGNDSVVARLNLEGERGHLLILSGRESTVRRLDEIRSRVGDDPAQWMPELLKGS
ncbi:VirB4 family type IV secretion/conjugal transfer ATPase [Sphingobium sp. AN558]|uniref:VirB4 family type IV secretion/conjugal transfer ATPase n=1 Tax=Sphingobium sp. AN558 TaxID=3133442 RepID=UPI0030BE036E